MTQDFSDLSELKNMRGYQKLQMLWAEQGLKIMDALNKASKLSGKDSSLRYHAGEWHGFDLAIGMLDRAMSEIQRQMGNEKEASTVDQILSKLDRRGDSK